MEKCRLIDLLNMIVNKTLKDKQLVIIEDGLYTYNLKENKFYSTVNKNAYRNIDTYDLEIKCYILYIDE